MFRKVIALLFFSLSMAVIGCNRGDSIDNSGSDWPQHSRVTLQSGLILDCPKGITFWHYDVACYMAEAGKTRVIYKNIVTLTKITE